MCNDCARLQERVLEQDTEIYKMSRKISNLRRELRGKKRIIGDLRKKLEVKKEAKQKYKNGRRGKRV